jgi:S-adenosylmethionine decarboxylase proenzyme
MMALKVKNNLESTKFLKDLLFQAIKESKATIMDYVEHKFEPQGYSLVVLIGESHASLHTYPEKNGIFFDFFTCGEIKTNIFKEHILNNLSIEKIVELVTFERGEK